MSFLERLTRFLRHLDERELYRLIGAVIGGLLLLIVFFCYFYFSTVQTLQRRLKTINQKRAEALTILSKYEIVTQQQQRVDALLKEKPDFRIKHFFTESLQELGLHAMLKKEPEISSQDLVGGYREIKLEARLSGLSMKQVVELLDRIEQNERVYVKEITMTLRQQNMLDILLTIATFEAIAASQ